MLISELSAISGRSRQWLNKLVDGDGIPGVRRKANGRLEIFNPIAAAKWAASLPVTPEVHATSGVNEEAYGLAIAAAKPMIKWFSRGRTRGSVKARVDAYAWIADMGPSENFKSLSDIARKYGVTRQALNAALKSAPLPARLLAARLGQPLKSH
jgi:hypothetical protein